MKAILKWDIRATLFYAFISVTFSLYGAYLCCEQTIVDEKTATPLAHNKEIISYTAETTEEDVPTTENLTQDSNLEAKQEDESVSVVYKTPKKKWTFIVYMAADNDLRGFAARNIKQMTTIGSNEQVNIVVELHIRLTQNKKITRRYFVEHGKLSHMNADDPTTQKMDSGDQKTLISCCSWAMNTYPAENYILILWNHGTGTLDPKLGRIVHATELFSFNPVSHQFELDRSIGFFDFMDQINHPQRGICWDDSTGNYLTNQKLVQALDYVCNTYNNGKKFAIIGFDACLMAMVEVADLIKKYADFMIGSQEVVLGTGLNYQLVLSPFTQTAPAPATLAQHIVAMYEKTYNKITSDYTLSAIDLSKIDSLNENIHRVSKLFLQTFATSQEEKNSLKGIIKLSRDKNNCTHFDEPSYIDLHHFYTNMKNNLASLPTEAHSTIIEKLKSALEEGMQLIENVVIANVVGKNLDKARGLSIYFPEKKLHFSYDKTPFAAHNNWIHFLTQYLAA